MVAFQSAGLLNGRGRAISVRGTWSACRSFGRGSAAWTRAVRLGVLAAVLASAWPGIARADAAVYEQVDNFAGILAAPPNPGEFPEDMQLGGIGGMAVNASGAGGVQPGTLYAAGYMNEAVEVRVARYDPDGTFVGAWDVRPGAEYSLCGPDPQPNCSARPGSSGPGKVDVDIDQATGNVYVLRTESLAPGTPAVTIYSPDGAEVIARFGELGGEGETTAASPGKIHSSPYAGGLAVDDTGKVYIFDANFANNLYHRLMVFEPQSLGDFAHYFYAGQEKDIGAGFAGQTNLPQAPVADAAGNIYIAGAEGSYIEKYDPTVPGSPVCSFRQENAGVTAMTVNRDTGEVFYFSSTDKKLHQLVCSEGEFVPVGAPFAAEPERDNLYALAFNPDRHFVPGREAGVLYGGAPSAAPVTGGKGQPGRGSLGYIFAPVEENPPLVLEESVSEVGVGSAEAHARINPKGPLTRYAFRYLTASVYDEAGESFDGAAESPLGGAALGGGQQPLAAAAILAGLAPDTEYRYRVVATSHCSASEPSKTCEAVGPTQSFRTASLLAPGLPDSRAYELVSPAIKNGGQVFPADPRTNSCGIQPECKPGGAFQHFPMQSTADGNAIVYEGSPFIPGEGAVIENEYRAQRGPGGWVSTNLTPSLLQSKGEVGGYRAFDPGLGLSVLAQPNIALSPEAPPGYLNLYLQPSADRLALHPLLTEGNATFHRSSGSGPGSLQLTYAGASKDLSRVFFEANDALTPDAVDGGELKRNLYEWSAGQLHLVNLTPGNGESIVGATFGSGTLLNSGDVNKPTAVFSHAISDDGSRAYWSSESGQVYV